MNHIDYDQARNDPSLRQQYLDSILYMCGLDVESIVYDDDCSKRLEQHDLLVSQGYQQFYDRDSVKKFLENTLFMVFGTPSMLGLGKPQPIYVSADAFERNGPERYFLNLLLDHETSHAQDIVHGLRINDDILIDQSNYHAVQRELAMLGGEIKAYNNQLKAAALKGMRGTAFFAQNELYKDFCIDGLNNIRPGNELERRMMDGLLSRSF